MKDLGDLINDLGLSIRVDGAEDYLYMCMVAKWLRDKHDYRLDVSYNYSCKKYSCTVLLGEVKSDSDCILLRFYDSYEAALYAGLLEALKQLKK